MYTVRSIKKDHEQFIASLGRRAADMELTGGSAVGAATRVLINEVERFLAQQGQELLTLQQAEADSGYSYDHLRKMITSGLLPNMGRRGKPLVKRGDLPRKPEPSASLSYDPAEEVAIYRASKRKAA